MNDADTPTPDLPSTSAASAEAHELHRPCVFDLDLTCGHCVRVTVNGWYPVSVACCDRLGGTWFGSDYIPFASTVDYVRVVQERYEHRRPGAAREPLQVVARRDRTDDPFLPVHSWQQGSAGRFPARVGAPANSQRACPSPPEPTTPAK